MPELPEVEMARRLLERAVTGRRIVRVRCADDPIVCEGVPPARIRRALAGRRVAAVGRHGKHLWLELDSRPWPSFHFGMAGGFQAPGNRGPRLVSEGRTPPRPDWPPRFTKLELGLDDGGAVAMTDPRRLGRIRLRRDPRSEPPISRLGWDALREVPSAARFGALLAARGAPVKAVLLDQAFAAGVGNWIADEVLYQAGIAPQRRASALLRAEAERLRRAICSVVGTAVRLGSDSDRFPRSWLFHYRWGRRADARDARGRAIRHATVGGRTTAWVPAAQR